ncbi:hypothetical protein G6F43_008578 [Rhizopus delemar]|nr:hypothetical protein G6F43_008578 [Rhizopus delemar]
MNVTAALVYDNQTYQDITIQTSLYQATVSFPTYSTPLPSYRSALNMSDNDLSQSSIGVYFIPYAYGNTLKSKLNDTYDSSDSTIRTFWSITTYFPQDDSSSGFIGSIRGYFAYIVALAAVFVIGVIFLRWWKLRRLRLNNTNDPIGNNVIYLQQRVNQIDPLPVNIVNSLPVKQYEMGSTKNLNCAICLEDFTPEKGDVRMLPCGHGFCVLCIDPWLTQKSTLCPICKWDCLPPEIRQERETDNDSTYPIDMYETRYASSLVTQHDVHHAGEHRDGPLSTAIEMNNLAHNQPEVEANSIPSDVSTCNSQAQEAAVLHSSDVQRNENISSPHLEPKNEQKDEFSKEIHK